jgi:glycosyltransferase involved in cell wall biosynthesis
MRPFSCDYYVGVSRFVRERLIANTCVPEDRCGYVLNGIEPVAKVPDARAYVRREFGLPANSVIVVSTGRATVYKGVDFILRCAERIVCGDARAGVYFLHCGDGPDLPRFQQMVSDYRLDGRFIFAGRRADVRRILPGCDIAIQASRGEAFSLSILEYLSAGLPTLAPDHCGNGEAVTSGVDGFLFRPDDLDDALAKLRTLLDNSTLRAQLGAAGTASIEHQFTLARTNRDLIDALAARL